MTELVDGKVLPERSAAYEARRMEILHKVALAFGEDGYHQTSVSNLADRIGVSKPVLYYYAKNKEDLLIQCDEVVQRALNEMIARTNKLQMSGEGKLRYFFIGYAEIMCGNFGRCMVLADYRALPSAAQNHNNLARRETEAAVCGIIREGQADGSVGPCNPSIAAKALFSAFNGIPRWFHEDGELNAHDVADAYLDLFVNGLGRRSS